MQTDSLRLTERSLGAYLGSGVADSGYGTFRPMAPRIEPEAAPFTLIAANYAYAGTRGQTEAADVPRGQVAVAKAATATFWTSSGNARQPFGVIRQDIQTIYDNGTLAWRLPWRWHRRFRFRLALRPMASRVKPEAAQFTQISAETTRTGPHESC